MGDQNGSSPRSGRQSPTPEPPRRQGLASIGLWADPCRLGEPGVAQRVPDRGDDLTPCHWRAIKPGQRRAGAVTTGHAKWQLRHDDGLFRSDSQADSAGSMPVTPLMQCLPEIPSKALLRASLPDGLMPGAWPARVVMGRACRIGAAERGTGRRLSGRTRMSQFWASSAWEPIGGPARHRKHSAGLVNRASCRRRHWSGLVRPPLGEAGASRSQANSLILIARSARRSYQGKAGSAVARSTIAGLATVWSVPRRVMTHQPAATICGTSPPIRRR
jgi:hypothetical protein